MVSFNYAKKTVTIGKNVNAPKKPAMPVDEWRLLKIILVGVFIFLLTAISCIVLILCNCSKTKKKSFDQIENNFTTRNTVETENDPNAASNAPVENENPVETENPVEAIDERI